MEKLSLLVWIGAFWLVTGCQQVSTLPLVPALAPADALARDFLGHMHAGEADSCLAMVNPSSLTGYNTDYITNACTNLQGFIPQKYHLVEERATTMFSSSEGNATTITLGYEYVYENRNALYLFTLNEHRGKLSIVTFSGEILPAPLAELTGFSLKNKSVYHYLFLFFMIISPLCTVTTLIVMLRSRLLRKQKVVWTLIILCVTLPRFSFDWLSGKMDYMIFNLNFMGIAYSKMSLYAGWVLSFNLPAGAIAYWYKRQDLLPPVVHEETQNVHPAAEPQRDGAAS